MQKGFTLIELMIVVAIIGILAVIGIPASQDYAARAQMAEALSLASGQKWAISEFHANKGRWPTDNTEAGIASATSITGKYVESVSVSGNAIVAKMKSTDVAAPIQGATVTLAGTSASDGSYSWQCSTSAAPRFLPAPCR